MAILPPATDNHPIRCKQVVALLLLLLAPPTASDVLDHVCGNMSYYAANSSYDENLQLLATIHPKNAASVEALFATDTTGFIPNAVHGLAQCRGDVDASTCAACLTGAFEDAQQMCTYDKDATIYYDLCVLRFSNQNFLHGANNTDGFGKLVINNSTTVNDNDGFMSSSFDDDVRVLINDISDHTANSSTRYDDFMSSLFVVNVKVLINTLSNNAANSSTRFATGVLQLAKGKLFGLAQCAPNITPTGCRRCLKYILNLGIEMIGGRKAGSVHALWCSYMYGQSSFFSGSPLIQLRMPPPVVAPMPAPNMTQPPPATTHQGSNHTVRTALIVAFIVVVVVLLIVVVFLFLRKRNIKAHKHLELARIGEHGHEEMGESLLYDLNTIRAATNNFSMENKLGQGAFGPVYKGTLQDRQEIAVKRLSVDSTQGYAEMKNEVVLLAKLQHRNLVRLLGYCINEHESLLVYEFLPNNSLAKILFDPARQQELGWGLRQRIIEGIGRGLLYLHQGSRQTVIHRDLKADNILLDAKMNPKISDFGLAKMFNVDSSVRNTSHIAGTFGYMAPEYVMGGILSTKSDVFSYGVLLLEIITGRRRTCTSGSSGPSEDLLTSVWRHWSHGSVQQLLDSCPVKGQWPQEILRCIHIGLLCIQNASDHRPEMVTINAMLNSQSMALPSPIVPAYMIVGSTVRAPVNPPRRTRLGRDGSTAVARESSINDASLSVLQPR